MEFRRGGPVSMLSKNYITFRGPGEFIVLNSSRFDRVVMIKAGDRLSERKLKSFCRATVLVDYEGEIHFRQTEGKDVLVERLAVENGR